MASSYEVHSLGLWPVLSPSFSWLTVSHDFSIPSVWHVGIWGSPCVGYGQAGALPMPLDLDNVLGSCCSRLGMTILGQPQAAEWMFMLPVRWETL